MSERDADDQEQLPAVGHQVPEGDVDAPDAAEVPGAPAREPGGLGHAPAPPP